jgi:tetratricopeptide (TPR) repeat protein
MNKFLLFAALVAAVAAAALLGGTLREGSAAAATPDVRAARALEAATELQLRVRATGDPALYPELEAALRAAAELDRASAAPLRGLAALAASRHRFAESLRLAEAARDLEPQVAAVYGLIGDASLELGRYGRAFAAFDRLAALKPSAGSYARTSYARELRGDLRGAIAAMRLAVDASAQAGEPAAWTRTLLGNLLLDSRRVAAAEASYRDALLFAPDYPAALAGLADVALARGEVRRALPLLRRAARAGAAPEFAAALGDTAAQAGRHDEARRAWREADELEALFARHGGRNLLETAEFDLNHDRNVRDALRRARLGRAERPSVEGDHVLAWALYKNGLCREARAASLRSLRLGTLDVDGLYHHSLIERCLGNAAAAKRYLERTLELDPGYLAGAPSATRLQPPAR